LTLTTENRPSASAPKNKISTPVPVKKASPSRNTRVVELSAPAGPASGTPGLIEPFFTTSRMTAVPRMNQAPPRAATNAPRPPTARCEAAVTSRPPSNAAAPGTTESQSRPEVYAHALSGV
jgi:hypothetical protein